MRLLTSLWACCVLPPMLLLGGCASSLPETSPEPAVPKATQSVKPAPGKPQTPPPARNAPAAKPKARPPSTGIDMTRQMDARDLRKAAYILEHVRSGNPTTWRNVSSGNEFTLTPTRTHQSPTGPCRDYTTDAYIDGTRSKFSGTACRLANGTWRFVKATVP